MSEVKNPQGESQEQNPGVNSTTKEPEIADDFFSSLLGGTNEAFAPLESEESEETTDENVTQPTSEQTPQVQPTQESKQDQPTAEELEERSSRYFQSLADKRQNEIDQLKSQLNMMKSNPQAGTQPSPGVVPQQSTQQPDDEILTKRFEEVAPPPQRPQKPAGFSRTEAYSDPSSASAKYLDEHDAWRDNMDEYRDLKAQYERVQQDALAQKQNQARLKEQQLQQMRITQEQNMRKIVQHLREGYGASDEQIRGFFEAMAKKSQLTVDDLWKLQTLNQGQIAPTKQTNQTAQPSQQFTQRQQTQNVPLPMGTIPNTTPNIGKSEGDLFIETLLGEVKKRNPFG